MANFAFPNLFLPSLASLDLIVIAIILLAICFWLVAFKSEARFKKSLQKLSDNSLYESQFKCVLFNAGNNPCKLALKFEITPILIKNTPSLPLHGCNAQKCSCSLLQHDDRRTGNDRRDKEVLDKRRKSIYANKRLLKDRRRASIREFLLPQYRVFS